MQHVYSIGKIHYFGTLAGFQVYPHSVSANNLFSPYYNGKTEEEPKIYILKKGNVLLYTYIQQDFLTSIQEKKGREGSLLGISIEIHDGYIANTNELFAKLFEPIIHKLIADQKLLAKGSYKVGFVPEKFTEVSDYLDKIISVEIEKILKNFVFKPITELIPNALHPNTDPIFVNLALGANSSVALSNNFVTILTTNQILEVKNKQLISEKQAFFDINQQLEKQNKNFELLNYNLKANNKALKDEVGDLKSRGAEDEITIKNLNNEINSLKKQLSAQQNPGGKQEPSGNNPDEIIIDDDNNRNLLPIFKWLAIFAVGLGLSYFIYNWASAQKKTIPPIQTQDNTISPVPTTNNPSPMHSEETKAETGAKTKAEAKAKKEAEAKAEKEAETKAETGAKTKAEAKAKKEAEAKAEADANSKAKEDEEKKSQITSDSTSLNEGKH